MFDAAPPADTPLLQDPAFAAALRACGQTPLILPGGLTVLVRRLAGLRVAMLPRAAPPEDLAAQLGRAGLHRAPLILSPEQPCTLPRALRLRAPQMRAVLDLSGSADQRRALLHPKWRNQLRRAEAANLRVRDAALRPDPHHPLLLAEAAQARARRYVNWPPVLTAAFAAQAPAQTRLFVARHKGHEVAQMLCLLHGRQATYHIGHITPAGKAHCAHNLLLWQAADWLAAGGYRTLDLGLLHPATPGLDRFKRRTGAQVLPTGGTWLCWHPLAHGRRP